MKTIKTKWVVFSPVLVDSSSNRERTRVEKKAIYSRSKISKRNVFQAHCVLEAARVLQTFFVNGLHFCIQIMRILKVLLVRKKHHTVLYIERSWHNSENKSFHLNFVSDLKRN